ncbi:hypothetical protein [Sporosarcina highlanderae]|uniref:Uncharacterized protein n=1 Tax=Sporosarcina highlanderae TaxID=3035916 RepID=A0ABT8JPY4_9BACL|nr:hypothetical protein [Sporosarcina highlanderae]MDN4606482.1 hypothetical protein [Sporosarcina highlanderae]
MRAKLLLLIFVCTAAALIFPSIPGSDSLKSVFRLTDEPHEVIVRGMSGSALTINISFGDKEVEQLISELKAPYPLLLLDMDWADRFPEIVQMIKKRNIPTGLLGHEGLEYEQNIPLLIKQLEKYEELFGSKPLWFRTSDEFFPQSLRNALWDTEVNALGSTVQWSTGEPPPVLEGEILSIPHFREERITLANLNRLNETRQYKSLEDVLFNMSIKTKKIPE